MRRALPGLLLAVCAAAPPAWSQQRVLALGGAVTETVFALDAQATLIGNDLTSLYPPRAASLPKVGYVRALGAEGILSLGPDLVLASSDAGPPEALRQVQSAAVPVVTLPEAHTPEAALERVRLVGAALHRPAETASVMAALQGDLAQVAADVAAAGKGPRVLFLLSAGRGAPMAAGAATAADAMLRLAGATNAVEGFNGYRPLAPEALLLAAPDIVLTTTQTLDGLGGSPSGLRAALPGLDAKTRIAAFDGLYLLGFGPRLAHALRDLAVTLHPVATIRPVPARPWAG